MLTLICWKVLFQNLKKSSKSLFIFFFWSSGILSFTYLSKFVLYFSRTDHFNFLWLTFSLITFSWQFWYLLFMVLMFTSIYLATPVILPNFPCQTFFFSFQLCHGTRLFPYLLCHVTLVPKFTLSWYSFFLIYLVVTLLFPYLPCHDTLFPLFTLSWHLCFLIYLVMLILFSF